MRSYVYDSNTGFEVCFSKKKKKKKYKYLENEALRYIYITIF